MLLIEFFGVEDELLEVIDLREEQPIGIAVLTVEISAREPGAVVPNCNAIWVEHRDYLEHEVLAQEDSLLGLPAQILQKTLHDVRAVRLPGMHPA